MSRRRVVVLLGGMASALAVMPAQASAGVYTVANCAADPSRYATEAFNVFATRGMGITKACSPQGKRTRGIVVGNTVRRGHTVKRGVVRADARWTRRRERSFVEYRWAGEPRRTDCRYAIQMWAEAPGAKPIPILNVRANEKCPRPKRAQLKQIPADAYSVPGATRIVHRVVCVGGGGRQSCSTVGLQPDQDLSRRGNARGHDATGCGHAGRHAADPW